MHVWTAKMKGFKTRIIMSPRKVQRDSSQFTYVYSTIGTTLRVRRTSIRDVIILAMPRHRDYYADAAEQGFSIDRLQRMIREQVLGSHYCHIFMFIVTIWTLFSDSIKHCTLDVATDDIFDTIISVAFFLFVLEILLSLFSEPDYRSIPEFILRPMENWGSMILRCCQIGSFYLWLDLIATLSLIFEVSSVLLYAIIYIADLILFFVVNDIEDFMDA